MAGLENDVYKCESIELTKAAPGQFIRLADGTNIGGVFTSDGSPEGSVTANPGSPCLDLTNGVWYFKVTGTGNTGWLSLFGGTGATQLPSGTTAQRPGTPVEGMLRYNTDNEQIDAYRDSAWSYLSTGYKLYSQTTVTTSAATEDISIPTQYDEVLIICSEIGITGGNTYLTFRMSDDAGSTFLSGFGNITYDTGVSTFFASTTFSTRPTNAAGNKRLTVKLTNKGSTNNIMNFAGYDTGSAGTGQILLQVPDPAVNMIRLALASAANLNGGTVYVWVK